MTFFNFSISYEYLYSPISWLHKQKNRFKIWTFFLKLTFLPFIPTQYIAAFLILFLCLYYSIYIPKDFKNYLHKMIILFLFFY